jgi:type I restriction-modification system DNA methylase subunit
MRQVRMKKEEKKFDFFMANSPYGKEDIDIL